VIALDRIPVAAGLRSKGDMVRVKSYLIILLCVSLTQAGMAQTPEPKAANPNGWFYQISNRYLPRAVSAVDMENSPRLESLMRAGQIYLSLQDAIALALENNLDIENARFGPRLSDANLQRANAGQLLRNVSSGISSGPSSASLGVLSGASSLGSGGGTGTGSTGGVLSGLNVQLAGTAIPNLDPSANFNYQFSHQTSPQTSSFVTGTNFLVSQFKFASYSVSKGFLTGTNATLSMNNTLGLKQNSPTNDFNPTTRANLTLQVSQRLLQGFGTTLNGRVIRVARNQRHLSDLQFRAQIIATVTNVVNLYYDLVSFNRAFKVRQKALELNLKLYEDNKRRAELGAIAPIEIVQAEAEAASALQDVTTAETQVLQQEMIIKNVITRTGVDNLAIASARIIPTDTIEVPEKEPIRPVQDLVAEAFQARPEIEQSRVGLENSRISMLGTRNAMMPSLDVYAQFTNNGLAGQVNDVPVPAGSGGGLSSLVGVRSPSTVNQFFLGGYGTVLAQLAARNFPDYTVGFQLNIPIRNRAAQADLITDQLNYRQAQINDKQLQNNIKVNVMNARVGLSQARSAYDTSVKARMLQEQTLNGERRKYQLGTSSFLNVVIVQRDATTRELAEVNALNQYVRSRTALQQVTGTILDVFKVDLGEAMTGIVKRPADLPVAPAAAKP
jgi:outer membrane protein